MQLGATQRRNKSGQHCYESEQRRCYRVVAWKGAVGARAPLLPTRSEGWVGRGCGSGYGYLRQWLGRPQPRWLESATHPVHPQQGHNRDNRPQSQTAAGCHQGTALGRTAPEQWEAGRGSEVGSGVQGTGVGRHNPHIQEGEGLSIEAVECGCM
jgi:hypothetical protein